MSGAKATEHAEAGAADLLNPSQWVRESADLTKILERHAHSLTTESQAVRRDFGSSQRMASLAYGSSSANETVDVYGTDLPPTSPVFVFFRGGGLWDHMARKDISAHMVQPLYNQGIVTMVVNYDKVPEVPLCELVEQGIKFFHWLLAYAQEKNTSGIVLGGHLSGSHLLATILSSDWFCSLDDDTRGLFRAEVHLSGLFDLRPFVNTSFNVGGGGGSGLVPALTAASAADMSPVCEANATRAAMAAKAAAAAGGKGRATYFFVAEFDSKELSRQANEYAKVLHLASTSGGAGENHISCQVVPMVDHFELLEKLARERYVVTKTIVSCCTE